MSNIIMIQLSVDELQKVIQTAIKEAHPQPTPIRDKDNKLLYSRAELMAMLDISAVTAINWERKGLLFKVKLGNLVYYKKEDIEALISECSAA